MASSEPGLLPFSGRNASCRKCGASVGAKWHGGGRNPGFPCHLLSLAAGEHMCRRCPHCGYGWMEATQDAGASTGPRSLRAVEEGR